MLRQPVAIVFKVAVKLLHAAIGHNAVLNLVPSKAEATLRRAMADHDRDFAAFYNRVADMLA